MNIYKINEIELIEKEDDLIISGVEICRNLGYEKPHHQASQMWNKFSSYLAKNSTILKMRTVDGKQRDVRCYNEAGMLFFIAKCNIDTANEITVKMIETFLKLRNMLKGTANTNSNLSQKQQDIKAAAEIVKIHTRLFKLDEQASLLWAQNLHEKNGLPFPNSVPALEYNEKVSLYGLSEIYDKYGIRGKGSRIKQQAIKSILKEYENDSQYAVCAMFERNGHVDTHYKYTDKALEMLEQRLVEVMK